MEILYSKSLSELMTQATLKVCWVSDTEVNRNGIIISEEIGKEIAATLPGAPIVGYFNGEDFEGHNYKSLVESEKINRKTNTIPFGFVSPVKPPWYDDMPDSDGVMRRWLLCEVFLWTEQFSEANKIIGKGQSMELSPDDEKIDGYWVGDYFVYTKATVNKLCVLGDNYEPCFKDAGFFTEFSYAYQNLYQKMEDEVERILGRRYQFMKDELILDTGPTLDDILTKFSVTPLAIEGEEEKPPIEEDTREPIEIVQDAAKEKAETTQSIETGIEASAANAEQPTVEIANGGIPDPKVASENGHGEVSESEVALEEPINETELVRDDPPPILIEDEEKLSEPELEELPVDAIITDESSTAVTEEAVTEEAVTEEAVTEEAVTEEAVTEGNSEEAVTEEAVTEEAVTEGNSEEAPVADFVLDLGDINGTLYRLLEQNGFIDFAIYAIFLMEGLLYVVVRDLPSAALTQYQVLYDETHITGLGPAHAVTTSFIPASPNEGTPENQVSQEIGTIVEYEAKIKELEEKLSVFQAVADAQLLAQKEAMFEEYGDLVETAEQKESLFSLKEIILAKEVTAEEAEGELLKAFAKICKEQKKEKNTAITFNLEGIETKKSSGLPEWYDALMNQGTTFSVSELMEVN